MSDVLAYPTERLRPGFTARRLLAVAVLIGGASLAACDEDPVDLGHDEGDVAGFQLRVPCQCPGGGQFVLLYSYTDPLNPDTLQLSHGESTEVQIVWLDGDGEVVDLDADDHSWEFEDLSNAMSFTPSASDPWAGTITTVSLMPGATVYGGFRVFLYHGEEREFETNVLVSAVSGN